MADQVLRELEVAAQIILAPPNLVSAEQRRSAETIYLNFRKTKSPYQLCRQILETSTMDYVLFETAGLIKTAVITEWAMLPKDDIHSLRQYLLHYVTGKPTLAPFVRERIIQVIAIMVKRGSVHSAEERKEILNEVEGFILSGDLSRQLLGCSIMSALLQEYATTVKSSDVGLTWELHFLAKKDFEVIDLKKIFKFSVSVLGELIEREITENILPLIKHLLSISEDVLVWESCHTCLPKRIIGAFGGIYKADHNAPLRLDVVWQQVILDPVVLRTFFTLYAKVRTYPQLGHHARNCLVQLGSLSGTVLTSDDVKLQYLELYVQEFLKLLSSIDVIDQEAVGIANMFRKIGTFFRPTLLTLQKDMLQSLIQEMTRLTCLFSAGAAQEESMYADDCLYMEAFEDMLETWICIMFEAQFFSSEFCKQNYMQIFNVYLRCHLSPPDGTRGAIEKDTRDDEIDGTQEDDRTKFKKQLQTIGIFARRVPRHSLLLLARLLEDRTSMLRNHLSTVVRQRGTNTSESSKADGLYEDLHWLVLIAGHTLCLESEGEAALVPSELMQYSIEQAHRGEVDINVTLQLFASPQSSLADINGAEQSADHIVRLISAVFRLCEIEKAAISANISNMLSPELSSTIVWFLHRWSLSYLMPIENCYDEISINLLQAFGQDSQGALWTMNFLMEKVRCNISVFKNEPTLMKETMKLLSALVDSGVKVKCLLNSNQIGALIELATKKRFDLPSTAKRGLMRVIVQIGDAVQLYTDEPHYWVQTLEPLRTSFKQIVTSDTFPRSYHQDNIRAQIFDILESLIGIAQGVHDSKVESVFLHVYPVLEELPNLISLYHNYQQIVQLILELFYECTKGMLNYLSGPESIRMYEACVHTVQAYARCNSNRLTVDSTAEEDSFQDILLLMQLLTNLLIKDIPGVIIQDQQEIAADAFLRGLNIVMPMMTILQDDNKYLRDASREGFKFAK
ncbi:exportin-4 isoform X2 [Orussus abietinus]|uniref:exportin-4 isoform X2 n=1 Tax=Orussus abietinus TaxID=222816 RepID=UPI000625FDE0|nr:exportin-4 isoform X2 [Orussus abietinus]